MLNKRQFKHNKDLIAYWLKRLVIRQRPKPRKLLTPQELVQRDMMRMRGFDV